MQSFADQPNPPPDGWMPIETAPKNIILRLAAYITPSPAAFSNGSRPHWAFGEGRELWPGHWSGILGGRPSHWLPLNVGGAA
jgi:hypothetical protein